MKDLREQIAEIVEDHYLWDYYDAYDASAYARCRCDVDNPSMTNGCEDGGWMRLDDYCRHVATLVTDHLVDLAGHGQLLASIDRLYRNEGTPAP